jgi:gag-polypeptide of LTR copia-type
LIAGIEVAPAKGTKGHDIFMQRNNFAYAELLISCECDVFLGLVHTSRSEDMPEGDARLAWLNLVLKFALVTKSNLIKTKKEFVDSRLEDALVNPDVWIQGLKILRRRLKILGHPISEMDLIIHIMHNLPDEYKTTVKFIENELENNSVTLDKVRERLRTKFERLNKSLERSEKALISMGKYKGTCNFCGNYGHKRSECRKRQRLKNKEEQGTANSNQNEAPNPVRPKIICYRGGT